MGDEKKPEWEDKPRVVLTYLGIREGRGNKLLSYYAKVKEPWEDNPPDLDGDDAQFLAYSSKIDMPRAIGQVFRVAYDAENNGTVWPGSVERLGFYPTEIRREWQVISQAVQTTRDMRSQRKKEESRDLLMEALVPLRREYTRLRSKHAKTAFLARVITYLQTGVKESEE